LLLAVVTLLAIGVLYLQTPWAHDWARRAIESRVNRALNGELRIGALTGSFWGAVTLANVSITQGGVPVLTAATISAKYRPWRAISTGTIDEVVLTGLAVDLVETPTGWNIAGLAKPRASPAATGPSITIAHLTLANSRVDIRPRAAPARHLANVNLAGAFAYRPRRIEIMLAEARAEDAGTGVAMRELSGVIRIEDRTLRVEKLHLVTAASRIDGSVALTTAPDAPTTYDVQLDLAPMSFSELAHYVPQVAGITVVPAGRVTMRGPADRLALEFAAADGSGRVNGRGTAAIGSGSFAYKGVVDAAGFNPAPWVGRTALAGRVTAHANVDAKFTGGGIEQTDLSFDVRGPEVDVAGYRAQAVDARGTFRRGTLDVRGTAVAYGARVRGTARWTRGEFSSRGEVARLDLRQLPRHLDVPALATDVAATYDVAVTGSDWRADGVFAPSVVEGARIAAGTAAHVARTAGELSYRATGSAAGLDLDRLRFIIATVRGPAGGGAANLPQMAGTVNATFDVDGRGTALASMVTRATLQITDSVIAGTEISMLDANASIDRLRLIADVTADVRGLSNQTVGVSSAFVANGRAIVRADIPDVTAPDWYARTSGSARISLASSTALDTPVDRLELDATMDAGVATIRTLDVQSAQLYAKAAGTLALKETGSSDLTYDITTSDLSKLPRRLPVSLSGSAHVAGRLTGSFAKLSTAGDVDGYELSAGSVRALTVTAKYETTTIDRDWANSRAKLVGAATFVEAGGQRIDQVTATVGYDAGVVDVDSTLDQRARSLRFAGSLVPHPEHREIHIRSLAAVAGDATWGLPQGQEALVQFTSDRVVIQNLDLVRNESRIRVSGAVGSGGIAEPLAITAERVQIADINKVLLGTHNLQGQLDAVIRIDGALSAPHVMADGAVVTGSIDGTAFDRLTGKVEYAADGLTLDAQLQAGAAGQFTARGTMPIRFGTTAPDSAPPFNLRVEAAQLNLALLQPLIPDLEQLTGHAAAQLVLSGPARQPVIAGEASIVDAGFLVAPTGVKYGGARASLTFAGEHVVVNEFRLEDDDKHVATILGGLNVSVTGPPSAFDLYVSANDFHVLNNAFGELSLDTDLHAMGDLNAPLVVGTIKVERGRLEVDDLIERLTAGGYTPLPQDRSATADVAAGATPVTGPASAASRASYSITLDLPDNLVVRGRDLRAPSGSFGLGDINATLGGALTLAKESGEPATIRGRLEVIRGQYTFQGRRFSIVRGSEVIFRGESTINPALNVTAERQIGGVTAQVRVTGTSRRPQLVLSSTPPLDQADVLSLIVFNSTMNELTTGDRISLAGRAGTLAARALATPLADSVMRALDFDLFEITPNEDVSTGASLAIGRQVNDRLFVGFRQNFGSDDVSQVSFEYRLTQFLRLVTTFAQGADRSRATPRAETAGLDLFFVIRR